MVGHLSVLIETSWQIEKRPQTSWQTSLFLLLFRLMHFLDFALVAVDWPRGALSSMYSGERVHPMQCNSSAASSRWEEAAVVVVVVVVVCYPPVDCKQTNKQKDTDACSSDKTRNDLKGLFSPGWLKEVRIMMNHGKKESRMMLVVGHGQGLVVKKTPGTPRVLETKQPWKYYYYYN